MLSTLLLLAAATPTVPYQLKCWDGSFAYNVLHVDEAGEQLTFRTSGQALTYLRDLIGPGTPAWGVGEATFRLPKSDCVIGEANAALLTCRASAPVTISGTYGQVGAAPTAFSFAARSLAIATTLVARTSADGVTAEAVELSLLANRLGADQARVEQQFPTAYGYCKTVDIPAFP